MRKDKAPTYLPQDVAPSAVWVHECKLELGGGPAGLALDLLHQISQLPQGGIRPGVDLGTAHTIGSHSKASTQV